MEMLSEADIVTEVERLSVSEADWLKLSVGVAERENVFVAERLFVFDLLIVRLKLNVDEADNDRVVLCDPEILVEPERLTVLDNDKLLEIEGDVVLV